MVIHSRTMRKMCKEDKARDEFAGYQNELLQQSREYWHL